MLKQSCFKLENINYILIIIAVIHAYLFMVMFFTMKRGGTRILGWYMLVVFIEYLLNANMYIFNFSFFNYIFYHLSPAVSIASIPFIYFYIRHMSSEGFVLKTRRNLIHFIPAVLLLIATLIVLYSAGNESRDLVILGTDKESSFHRSVKFLFFLTNILLFLQIFFYSAIMIRLIFKHISNLESTYSYKEKISLKWLLAFVMLFLTYYLFEFVVFISSSIPVSETLYFAVITFHVFFIGIMGLQQREIYENKGSVIEMTPSSLAPGNASEPKKAVYSNEEEKLQLAYKIKEVMQEKKIYMNPELSLYDLAQEINIHKNYVSHIINEVFGMNFFNFVNQYRIEEAKVMLKDPSFSHLSVDGIARSVGFKSRNVFYPVFKKFVGMTPVEFKNK